MEIFALLYQLSPCYLMFSLSEVEWQKPHMCPCSCFTECYCAGLMLFFSICCLHSKRLYFVFMMSEFSAGLTAGKSFSGAASADLQCRACRSSLGLLPLVCVLLCISFFRLHLPTPLSSLGAFEGSHSSLWAQVKYAYTRVLVHLGVYTAMDTSIHFSQPAEELLQPCISSHAPCRWACSFENWPLILPPCFPLLRYFQSLSLSQIP